LVDTVDRLAAGDLEPTPQDDAAATYAPKLATGDRWIDWERPADEIVRRVRALAPAPGSSTRFRDRDLKVSRAAARPGRGDAGAVLEVGREGFVVAAGEGSVAPLELAPAGRRRMTAAEFVRGYRPTPGERFEAGPETPERASPGR